MQTDQEKPDNIALSQAIGQLTWKKSPIILQEKKSLINHDKRPPPQNDDNEIKVANITMYDDVITVHNLNIFVSQLLNKKLSKKDRNNIIVWPNPQSLSYESNDNPPANTEEPNPRRVAAVRIEDSDQEDDIPADDMPADDIEDNPSSDEEETNENPRHTQRPIRIQPAQPNRPLPQFDQKQLDEARRLFSSSGVWKQYIKNLHWVDLDEAERTGGYVSNTIPNIEDRKKLLAIFHVLSEPIITHLANTNEYFSLREVDKFAFRNHIVAKGEEFYVTALEEPNVCLYLLEKNRNTGRYGFQPASCWLC
jgi:hypothetical protein